jgi:hypothetical protein
VVWIHFAHAVHREDSRFSGNCSISVAMSRPCRHSPAPPGLEGLAPGSFLQLQQARRGAMFLQPAALRPTKKGPARMAGARGSSQHRRDRPRCSPQSCANLSKRRCNATPRCQWPSCVERKSVDAFAPGYDFPLKFHPLAVREPRRVYALPARVEQRVIGGAGRGCAADRTLR